MAKQNKPAIRFKGFTDAWEQRKFSDLYAPLVERNSDLLPYNKTLSVATMTYKTDGNGAADSSLANYKRLRTGDIAFEGHTSKSFRYGRFVLNDVGDGIMSPRFSALRPLAQMPTNFWKYYIHYEPIMRKILVASTKAGTMMNELVIDEFLKSSVLVPSIEEQTRIGSILKNIDNLITLHQRKFDKLQVLKKAMLEKMFPKNGSSVPEIRFKGFTDAWEQRKLGELLKTITTGKSVNSDDGAVAVGDIGILKTSCVSYDRFNPYESKPVVKDELQSVKCAVEKDSVIVSRMNTPERVGACGYVSTDFPNLFLPDRLWKLKFQDNVDAYFVYMMLVSSVYKEKITSMASGTSGSMYNIPKETFLNLQLVVPVQTSEQRKIGQVLRQLNDLITLHQRELEKLQNIKKSMLEKMFV